MHASDVSPVVSKSSPTHARQPADPHTHWWMQRSHSSSSLHVLLTQPVSASDVGAWSAKPKSRFSGRLVQASTIFPAAVAPPRPNSAAIIQPSLALRAAKQRHSRSTIRPPSAAEAIIRSAHAQGGGPRRPSTAGGAGAGATRGRAANVLVAQDHSTSTSTAQPTPPAEPASAQSMEDVQLAHLARNLFYHLCVCGQPLKAHLPTIVRLLQSMRLFEGVDAARLREVAAAAEVRHGVRYQSLYTAGTSRAAAEDGFAFVLLNGHARASEGTLPARGDTAESLRGDSYAPGALCGAELLAAPPRGRRTTGVVADAAAAPTNAAHAADAEAPATADAADAAAADADDGNDGNDSPPTLDERDAPLVPRMQTCTWMSAGAALALPLSLLATIPRSPPAARDLEKALCAQVLSSLLLDRDRRPPRRSVVAQLAEGATMSRHEPGSIIYLRGAKPLFLIFLVRGDVELFDAAAPLNAPPIETHREPGPIGAVAVLSEAPRTESVRAPLRRSCITIQVPASHAHAALLHSPNLRSALLLNAAGFRTMSDASAASAPAERALPSQRPKSVPSPPPPRPALSASAAASASPPPPPQSATPFSASRRSRTPGSPWDILDRDDDLPPGAQVPEWHRTRATLRSRRALMELPAGVVEPGGKPWTVLINRF